MEGLDLVKFTAEHSDGVISCCPVDRAESFFNRLIQAGQVIPKFHKGKLIGFAAYYRTCAPQSEFKHIPDWTLPEQYTFGPYVFVDLVVIHPKYRKQRILEYFIDRIKKLKPYFHAGFWLEQDGVWHAQERAENMRTNCGILAFDKITGMLNGRANVISLSTLARIAQDNEFLLFPMKVQQKDLARLEYPFVLHNDFHFETITNPFELGMFNLPEESYVLAQSDEIGLLVDDEEARTVRGSKKFWKQVVAPLLGFGGGAGGGALLGTMLLPGLGTLGGATLGATLGGAGGGALVGPMTGRAPTLGETLSGAVSGGLGGGLGSWIAPASNAVAGGTLGAMGGGMLGGLSSGASNKPGAVTGGNMLGSALAGLGGGLLGGGLAGTSMFGAGAPATSATGGQALGSEVALGGTPTIGGGSGSSLAGTLTSPTYGASSLGYQAPTSLTGGIGAMGGGGGLSATGGAMTSAPSSGVLNAESVNAIRESSPSSALDSLFGTPSAYAAEPATTLPGATTQGASNYLNLAQNPISVQSSALDSLYQPAATAATNSTSGFNFMNALKSPQSLLGLGTLGAGLMGTMSTPDMPLPAALGDMGNLATQLRSSGAMTPAGQAAQGAMVGNIQAGPVGLAPALSKDYMDSYMNALKMPQEAARQNYATTLNATAGGPFSSNANQLMGQFSAQQAADTRAYLSDLALKQQNLGTNAYTTILDIASRGDANAMAQLVQLYGDVATAQLAVQAYNQQKAMSPWQGLQNVGGTMLGNSLNPLTSMMMQNLQGTKVGA